MKVRFDLRELAGGLGDAGLFIPIAAALVSLNGLNATMVFAGSGLVYMATAAYFRVPVPVQPLKAFAAAAIALNLGAEELAAGALLLSGAMAILAASGLADWVARRFPVVLIRGIQASVALLLGKAAIELAEKGNWQGLPTIDPALSIAAAVAGCAILLSLRGHRGIPGSLAILSAGALAGLIVEGAPAVPSVGPQGVTLALPDGHAFAAALTALVLAQIPLTFGNSVVATGDAEREYFGEAARRVRPGRLAGSIAGANLLAGLTSGLPVCHGAGGVTAHYRMGARTAGATLLMGFIYLTLGIAFGASLVPLLHLLLPCALAAMLLFVAVEHGLLAARLERFDDRVLAAAIGAVTLWSGNLAIGVGAGAAALLTRWMAHRVGDRIRVPARVR